MNRHNADDVDQSPDSVLRDLFLVVESEQDADPDDVNRLVRRLRAELMDLDVESVATVASENAPPGAKGDPVSLGALLITLGTTGGVFAVLMETARDWLARQATAQRISVTIDGDTIVLEKSSEGERSELIDVFIRRHEVQ